MCVYLYIHNKYTQYTQKYYVHKNFYFWMRLIVINRCPAVLEILLQFYFFYIYSNVIYYYDGKAEILKALLQSSVSHDSSEIILIC